MMMSAEPCCAVDLIRLERVSLRVGGRWILPETSWTIRQGENWVVRGPNGSGKTSLTAALTGEVPVVAGRRWLNPDVIDVGHIARLSFETHQQLVARDERLDESRGFATIDDPGTRVHALLAAAAPHADSLKDVSGRLALADLMEQPIRSLSTGEMRRLLVARALLGRPRLLILDEPFDGLDGAMRRQLADTISALVREGLQIILVTHRVEECLPVMTHYLVLGQDRILEKGEIAAATWRLDRPSKGKACQPPALSSREDTTGSMPDRPAVPMIRMRGTTVAYGRRVVLDKLDWCVYPGENWLVSGANGAGKSTLLRLISADHLQAYANDIYLFGRRRGSGESIWEIKQRIGMVSGELQIHYRRPLSGYQTVLSGFFDSVGLFRQADRAQQGRARRWMARLAIEGLAEMPFDRMSSGQRRMVLIARAVVKDPDLLILDEPCQGLDAPNRARVLTLVDYIGTRTPTSLIFTTHHAEERPACMTRELRLIKGRGWDCRRIGTGHPPMVDALR